MTALIGNPLLLTSPPAAGGDDAYQIEKSLRFNSADTPKLSRPFSLGNIRTLTWSGWVKRNTFGVAQSIFGAPDTGNTTDIEFDSSDRLIFTDGGSVYAQTTAVFRDPSSWYHIVLAHDTTQQKLEERVKLYVNGILQTVTTQNYGQNSSSDFGANGTHTLGSSKDVYSDTILADVHYIDGLQLSPAAFGQFSSIGVWDPKAFGTLPAPNDNYTYSAGGNWTASSGTLSNITNVFDGSEVTQLGSSATGATFDFVLPTPIEVVNSVEITQGGFDGKYQLNYGEDGETALQQTVASTGWNYFQFTGTLKNIRMVCAAGNTLILVP